MEFMTHDEKIALTITQILELKQGSSEPTLALDKLYRAYFD